MRKLTINEFITLQKKLKAYNLSIYPLDKTFLELKVHEILKLGRYFPETCQVITINLEKDEVVELIPIRELVATNFSYFKDAKNTPHESVDRYYSFVIYENVKTVSEAITKWQEKQTKSFLIDM